LEFENGASRGRRFSFPARRSKIFDAAQDIYFIKLLRRNLTRQSALFVVAERIGNRRCAISQS
jgi:hypothetical protein